MRSAFAGSFLSDVKKVREAKLRRAIAEAIQDVEAADSIRWFDPLND
jgi:hypothetical protein